MKTQHVATAAETPADEAGCVSAVDRLLVDALKALAAAGHEDHACRIAAQAWSATRHAFPEEAQRFNGLLHYLTARRPAK